MRDSIEQEDLAKMGVLVNTDISKLECHMILSYML